jgi:hypothetical protein
MLSRKSTLGSGWETIYWPNTLRHALAFPLAHAMSFANDLLGAFAAKIAGDDWPG